MTNLPIIFSDASFNPQTKIAVWGFLKNDAIVYGTLFNTSNIKAEIYAFDMAQKYADCDCLFGVDCEKVMSMGQEKGLNMLKIKGHKPSKMKTEIDKKFSIIDKFVRKQLRIIIKTQNGTLVIGNNATIFKTETNNTTNIDSDIVNYIVILSII